MQYDDFGIKLQKRIQDTNNHKFYVDWDAGIGRCPICNNLVTTPVRRPLFFKIEDTILGLLTTPPKIYLIRLPNVLTQIHLNYSIHTNQTGVQAKLYKGPTVDNEGTRYNSINITDGGSNTSDLGIYYGSTVSNNGYSIIANKIWIGQPQQIKINPLDELILQQNLDYLLEITPFTNNTDISIEFNWIEVS